MIRDVCATVLALGALAWGGRLIWLGPPAPSSSDPLVGPWIDEGCSSMVQQKLDEVEPESTRPAASEPPESALARARELVSEPASFTPEALRAIARAMVEAEALHIEANWSRPAPDLPWIEAEFRADGPTAVGWLEAFLRAADDDAIALESCRWSLIAPLGAGESARVIGRLRCSAALADAAPEDER